MASQIIDDKSEHCVPFILKALERHVKASKAAKDPPTFFIGLNGVQGAGKTTLVCTTFTRGLVYHPQIVCVYPSNGHNDISVGIG